MPHAYGEIVMVCLPRNDRFKNQAASGKNSTSQHKTPPFCPLFHTYSTVRHHTKSSSKISLSLTFDILSVQTIQTKAYTPLTLVSYPSRSIHKSSSRTRSSSSSSAERERERERTVRSNFSPQYLYAHTNYFEASFKVSN